jgi:hypothetical protein
MKRCVFPGDLHLAVNVYPPSQKAANLSWRMNAERVPADAVLAMRGIAAFIAKMIGVGGCASAGFAESGALMPPTSVSGAPLGEILRSINKE